MKCIMMVICLLAASYAVIAEEDFDFYELLGVSREASEKEVKKAYRAQSLKYHPDTCVGDKEECNKQFQFISEAYEVISNAEKRRVYDTQGKVGLEKAAKRDQQRQQGQGQQDMFAQMFGGGVRTQEEPRGQDVRLPLRVTLSDLYNGKVVNAWVKKQALCPKCRGSGARSPKDIQQCSVCKGEGVVIKMHQIAPGFMQQVQQQCGSCGGSGSVIRNKCPHCGGRKIADGEEELRVDVEKGMDTLTLITFEHKADAHPDKRAGHIIFVIQTDPHPLFSRRQNDLDYEMHITLAEALLGFTKEITHLDGHTVEVSSRGITKPGQVTLFEEEGMPVHNYPSQHGNLYVKFVIDFPAALSAAQKAGFASLF